MIEGQKDIREAYRDDSVARDYIARRFNEPLGAMLHRRQVERLRTTVQTSQLSQVLEVAPGPARLTVDVAAWLRRGTIVDASAQMLAQAKMRLDGAARSGWRLVQGDAFLLPFGPSFDLVYSFRLIRHFDREDRARLYRSIAGVLRPGGLLVFDAINRGPSQTPVEYGAGGHYDALLSPDELRAELERGGFRVRRLDGVQHHYAALYRMQVLVAPRSRFLAGLGMEIIDRIPRGQPREWIVTCERI